MSTQRKKLFHVFKVRHTDHTGKHDGGEVRVSVTRTCSTCAHFRTDNSDDWSFDEFGPCMNLVYPCAPGLVLDCHQTEGEWGADVHRPHRPVLELVATTE